MTTIQDLSLGTDQRLEQDDTLATAIFISLLTDARANQDDELPPGTTDLRGHWGDTFAEVQGDSMGSRLWTLEGGPIETAMEKAEPICREALQWLVDDGLLVSFDIAVERSDYSEISIRINCVRPNGAEVENIGPFTVTL